MPIVLNCQLMARNMDKTGRMGFGFQFAKRGRFTWYQEIRDRAKNKN